MELPTIFLAGGSGLLIAKAILLLGKYRRRDGTKYCGSLPAKLVFGIVPMLIITRIIEGFVSPNPIIPDPIKYLVGMGLFILLIMYCSRKNARV